MDRTRRHRGYVLCYDASEAKRGRVKKKITMKYGIEDRLVVQKLDVLILCLFGRNNIYIYFQMNCFERFL